MTTLARLLAFYLPQFHPIPENDAWWGKGFTEWTNTAKAVPLFRGHYQPHVPADLGFYDLRLAEAREAQAVMAKDYGIEGFCYYHYWFAGKLVLERPLREVIATGRPDFPFCVCWANQTWSGIWHGAPDRVLLEQTYPGDADHRAHFEYLLPAFADRRYAKQNGMPVFIIYRPIAIPEVRRVTDLWRKMAVDAGLPGLHLVGIHEDPQWDPTQLGFDAVTCQRLPARRGWVSRRQPLRWASQKLDEFRGRPTVYRYEDALPDLMPQPASGFESYPMVTHAWDNSPRSGANALVLHDSNPELFRRVLRRALQLRADVPPERNLVFLKSWNEWAEGNHLEPDLRFGHGYLDVIREECVRPV
ncbi:MAG: glycoside hydrolase family 99-like domain-containing protein [Casimicrobiaceae bacterium]